MKLVLVDDGKHTAVYHEFYKNKLGVYKTSDGLDGLMELLGVEVVKSISCPNAKEGKLIDPTDGFPCHLDNLPKLKKITQEPERFPKSEEVPKKKTGAVVKKAGRKARRPPKRKSK